MKLFKMHISLFKYLRVEIPKQKSLQDLIKFLKGLGKNYCKAMLQEYKNCFLVLNADYRKQKAEYEKYQKLQQDLQRCIRMLDYIDTKMEKEGKTRREIRIFWADFIKNRQVRKEVWDMLMKEIR